MTKNLFLLFIFFLTLASCLDEGHSQVRDFNNMSEDDKQYLKDSIERALSNIDLSGKKVDETRYHKRLYRLDSTNIKYLTNYADYLGRNGNIDQAFLLLHNALKWSEKKAKVYKFIGDIWQVDGAIRSQKK